MMRKALLATSVLSMLSIFSGTAFAACYQTVMMPAKMTCLKDSSHSADFAQSCTWKAAYPTQVAVACPVVVGNSGGGGGSGGGSGGGHYVDTNGDGRTDSFRSGGGFGSSSPGALTSKNSYTSSGQSGQTRTKSSWW